MIAVGASAPFPVDFFGKHTKKAWVTHWLSTEEQRADTPRVVVFGISALALPDAPCAWLVELRQAAFPTDSFNECSKSIITELINLQGLPGGLGAITEAVVQSA